MGEDAQKCSRRPRKVRPPPHQAPAPSYRATRPYPVRNTPPAPHLRRAAAAAPPAAALTLAPNPSTGCVAGAGAAPQASITVLDALGRCVLAVTADAAGSARLQLPAGLAPGVYVVRGGTQARRLAVE